MFFESRMKGIAAAVLLSVVMMISLTGCGVESDFQKSPKLIEMETQAIVENGQMYVLADLIFDLPTVSDSSGPDELRVTLGGERVSSSDIEVLNGPSASSEMIYDFKNIPDEQVVHLKIKTDSVVNGILKIKAQEKLTLFRHITDPTGQYSIKLFSVNKCVKSGAALYMNSTEAQNISLTVTKPANKCDVMLIKLRDDDADSTIEPDAGTYDQLVDKSLIVREDNYPNATATTTAKAIADTVNKCYGSHVSATASGTNVTMVSKSKSDTHHYSLQIYEY